MWNKAYGLETANSKGIPLPCTKTSVRPQHLTETKCEQMCTRKREITFGRFNPPVSSVPNKSLRLCTVVRKRNRVMYTEGEVGRGGKKKSKKISGKEIYNSGEMFPLLLEQKQQQ